MLQKKEGLTRIEMGEKKQREGGVTLKESIPHLIQNSWSSQKPQGYYKTGHNWGANHMTIIKLFFYEKCSVTIFRV